MPKAEDQFIKVNRPRVACDGGGGVSGHPKTYYVFGNRQRITCAYCGQVFVRQG